MNNIDAAIEKNKQQFILHNIVRLREMIRYLPPKKLNLFKLIPLLIHINTPGFPGYVESYSHTFGIWNFENTGFGKEFIKENNAVKKLIKYNIDDAAVQALYHIGSLGTFTQSEKSDFDYWVIINRARFSTKRYDALKQKLNLITIHSRKKFSQEVSFFIHDAQALIKNQLEDPAEGDLTSIPEILIKEEFYRTFIMIAGKMPAWVVLPCALSRDEALLWKKHILQKKEFIDLGEIDKISKEEIKKGLLWQICKSRYDPVKSVIKASITASYNVTGKNPPKLTCDMIKDKFRYSIIDDYAADPYIIAFERVLDFYAVQKDFKGLAHIKVAIFFRLCGFPRVALPPKDSPKRKILNKYILKWKLSNKRLKKLLSYQDWPESEKTVFDASMLSRLTQLYILIDSGCETKSKEEKTRADRIEPSMKVLKNKAKSILSNKKGKIPICSIFLRIRPHKTIIIKRNAPSGKPGEWHVYSQLTNSDTYPIYSSMFFLQTIGWIMSNHLYIRGTSSIKLPGGTNIYGSLDRKSNIDDIYMALQPWMPLSDDPFLSPAHWERIVILMTTKPGKSGQTLNQSQLLARNSWGEIFFDVVNLETIDNLEHKCYLTGKKIMDYLKTDPKYSIFQLSGQPIPGLIQKIKTIVENSRQESSPEFDLSKMIMRRPYLDTI